jgi:hypothetical protein
MAELISINVAIEGLREKMPVRPYPQLGWRGLAPVLENDARPIQQRMDDMEKTVGQVTCYVKLLASTRGIRIGKLDGRTWLKGFHEKYRKTQARFRRLIEDAVYQTMTLFIAIGLDAQQHATLAPKMEKALTAAMGIVKRALPRSENPELQSAFCFAFAEHRIKEYLSLSPMERLVPDAASLSERALVQRFARLFELNLQRWDRCHGLRLPQVRRILEVFAYEMEDKFAQGIYDLVPLFIPPNTYS